MFSEHFVNVTALSPETNPHTSGLELMVPLSFWSLSGEEGVVVVRQMRDIDEKHDANLSVPTHLPDVT